MKCKSCKYWEQLPLSRQPHLRPGEDEDSKTTVIIMGEGQVETTPVVLGQCRRNAPTPNPELVLVAAETGHMYAGSNEELDIWSDLPAGKLSTIWPLTDRTDWCGEYVQSNTAKMIEDNLPVTNLRHGHKK